MRLQSARHDANDLHVRIAKAMPGWVFVNMVKARRLRGREIDLVKAQLVHPSSTEPEWEPPKRASEFAELLAQVVNWTISSGPHAGEKYSGVYASNEEIAEALGISPSQWKREAYFRAGDGKLVSRGGTRAWLSHHLVVRTRATTQRTKAGQKHHDGAARPWGFGPNLYEPGPALEQMLGIHDKRVRRYRLRIEGAAKRRWKLTSEGQTLYLKSSGSSSSLRSEELPAHRARARGRKQPLVRQRQTVPPVDVGVGGQPRRQAPDAPPADRRHAPCTTQSRNEPDGHEGRDSTTVGDEPAALRQAAPPPAGATNPPAEVSAPPAVCNAPSAAASGAGKAATERVVEPSDRVPADDTDAKAVLAAFWRSQGVDPNGIGGERATAPSTVSGRQAFERQPESLGGVLDAFGDAAALVGRLQEAARRRAEDARKRGGGGGAKPPAAAAPPLGDERTPEEQAANERRRDESKARARRESERIGGDEPPLRSSPPTEDEGDDT